MIARPIQSSKTKAIIGFSIDHYYFSRHRIKSILNSCRQVTDVKIYYWKVTGNIRASFRYMEIEHVIYEPFGESTEYIFEAKDPVKAVDVRELYELFAAYQPHIGTIVIIDILSLNFINKLFALAIKHFRKNR